MNSISYWVGYLCIDFIKFFLYLCIVYPILIYNNSEIFILTLPFAVLFIIAQLLVLYSISLLFEKEVSAQQWYMAISLLGTMLLAVGIFSIRGFSMTDDVYVSPLDFFPPSTFVTRMFVLYL